MRRFLYALGLLLALSSPAWAINCAVANGACFWIGGTGTWDEATDSAHWSNSSGGTTCSCEPIASNSITLDGSSGGGTVTVNANVSHTNTLTTSAYTGTLDFSVNNNSPTFTQWNDAGSGTHTVNMGSGTFTLTITNAAGINFSGASMTLNAGTSTVLYSATATAARPFTCNAKTFNNVTVTNGASNSYPIYFGNSCTISGTLILTNVRWLMIGAAKTITVTGAITFTGGSTTPILVSPDSLAGVVTLAVASAWTPAWVMFIDTTKSGAGSIVATNCFDGGNNTSITCPAPNVVAGGGTSVIGGGT